MITTKKHFEKFYENIKLTLSQRDDAKKKYSGVCKKLHDHYYSGIEYSGDTKLLIGSYGKQTNIRPPRDIDVLFIMPPEKYNQSNGQSQLLQDIKNILSEKYTTTDKIRGWGKVVLIQFSDGTHNIELLPAWEKNDKRFTIPNSENGGSWETYDPKKEIETIKKSDEKTGQTKMLIRMIKKWSEQCSAKIKSYKIENTVVVFFASGKPYDEYSTMVKHFFEFFHNNINDENLKSYLNTALNRAQKACNFENDDKLEQAFDEWRKIFGDDFPKNDANKKMTNSAPQPIINPPKPHGY